MRVGPLAGAVRTAATAAVRGCAARVFRAVAARR
jgi:hypothetical protein